MNVIEPIETQHQAHGGIRTLFSALQFGVTGIALGCAALGVLYLGVQDEAQPAVVHRTGSPATLVTPPPQAALEAAAVAEYVIYVVDAWTESLALMPDPHAGAIFDVRAYPTPRHAEAVLAESLRELTAAGTSFRVVDLREASR